MTSVDDRERPAPIPLSFGQQRLWFLDRLLPNTSLYNIPMALRLVGRLDIAALRRSLDAIVMRHESLRTVFVERVGLVEQVVQEPRAVELPVLELDSPNDLVLRETIVRLGSAPFDLSRDLMIRGTLLRLSPEEYVLILVVHHIASDAWSQGVLFRELASFYRSFTTGTPCELPALPWQYADYTIWQRSHLTDDRLEKHLTYWRQKLADIPQDLSLPLDHPRSLTTNPAAGWETSILQGPSFSSLQQRAKDERVTLFMLLAAAFSVLLQRYGDTDDVVMGSTIAGRTEPETEGLIGFLVNTLVLRIDLSGDPTFRELLGRVRSTALEAYAHQDLPFEKLVEAVQPERSINRSPFFRVMVEHVHTEDIRLAGLVTTPIDNPPELAMFDLTVMFVERGDSLIVVVMYNRELFEPATIRRLLGHFESLLTAIPTCADRPISELPILTPAERQQIVVEWNATRCEFPRDRGIHEIFEAQVQRAPQAVAIAGPAGEVTYDGLNRRANQLAGYLRACGAGPDDIVGLCCERSADLIVAMLAILKAGGAYLPLDPSQPPDRLGLMLEDARARLLVTRQPIARPLPAGAAKVVLLDEDDQRIAQHSDLPLADPNEGGSFQTDRLAYVMYTSGSTGRPKGVAVPHRAVNRLVLQTNYIDLRPDDVVAQVSNAAFDAATFEIWGALLNGARLLFVDRDTAVSPRAFAEAIRRRGVTTMFVTTALFNHVASEEPSAFQPLRHLLFGGEAAEPRWVRAVLRAGAPARLVNVYGPTETTTFASWYEVQDVPEAAVTIPIGTPIANTSLRLLDRRRAPVPIGVVGELYIGGPGVARGYLHDEDLTAARFLAGSYADEPVLYRTGDLARYRPDGNIEFVGRRDGQVKIRGFRVELAEIETALAWHPLVAHAVVLLAGDTTRDRHLVAYVVPHDRSVSLDPLRPYLQQRLPDYMLPAQFVAVDSIPLTANGKVDRARLATLPVERPVRAEVSDSPTDPLEAQLLSIWGAVLGVHPIGRHDNFFALGGHSLLAARLVAEIDRACGIRVPLAVLFQAATVADLVRVIRADGLTPHWASLIPIQSRGGRPPLFCVHGIGGNLLGYRDLALLLGPDQPVYGLQAVGLDAAQAPHTTVEAMAAHYVAELERVRPAGPYHLVGLSFGGTVAFEMAQQLRRRGHEVGLVALLDTGAPPLAGTDRITFSRYQTRARFFLRRARYLVARILLQPKRLQRLRAISRTARRKVGERVWQLSTWPYRMAAKPLPKPLRQVPAASRHALRKYRAERYSGGLTLFRANTRSLELSGAEDLGWQKIAGGGLEIVDVPGDHVSLLEHPNVEVLAKKLRSVLESTDDRPLTQVERSVS